MGADRYLAKRETLGDLEVAFGYQSVRVLDTSELAAGQDGYAGEGWSATWLVIATEDLLGDPIFVDLASDALAVFTAAHGEGTWEPVPIADSLDAFVAALHAVQAISVGRGNPVQLEQNPLPDDERLALVAGIQASSPASDMEFWDSWLFVDWSE